MSAPATARPLRVISLIAENVKRIKAVEIRPDGDVVVITGRNGQGKSSVLDAIWMALENAATTKSTPRPIRDGADTARVRLDLGEIIVTRTWTDAGTRLRVESAEGALYRSPQALLDSLIGRLAFDPLAFAQQPERQQVRTLLGLIDLPIDPSEIDAHRAAVYEQRTQVNREVRRLEGQLAGMPEDPGAPYSEMPIADAFTEIQTARAQVASYQSRVAQADRFQERLLQIDAQIAELERERESVSSARHAVLDRIAVDEECLPDIAAMEADLADLDARNRRARAAAARRAVLAELAARRAESEEYTRDIACLDETKRTALEEAVMPLPGLGFDDTGVTYRGVPLRQCSSSEQLRVSVAMAMALNPRLRVIRIQDGSLLDRDSMRLIEEMAAEHDYQVWVERVDDRDPAGVLIEDGQVVSWPIETAGEVAR